MSSAMMHRGPDGMKVEQVGEIVMGHTLLSVRGMPNRGVQPVLRGESQWALSFNGEIYNTDELETALGLGEDPGRPDTEVLYTAILHYGWQFIQHIEGTFAIALYNKDEDKLCLYRDPSGQNPLYYLVHQSELYFASEIKALSEVKGVDWEADLGGIQWAAMCGFIPDRNTLVKGVQKLLPGEQVIWDNRAKSVSLKRIQNQNIQKPAGANLRDVIRRTVGKHLASSHPIALNLSGGLDSAVLLYEVIKCGKEVVTYTSSYEESARKANTELPLAKKLAKRFGVEHREIRVRKNDYWDRLIESYTAVEEPNGNVSIPLYYYMAERQGIRGDGYRVVLTGCGGDELFYGYPRQDQNFRIDRWQSMLSAPIVNWLYQLRYRRKVALGQPVARWLFNRGNTGHWLTHDLEDPANGKQDEQWAQDYIRAYGVSDERAYHGLLMDRCAWLANENFVRMNKLYMRESTETRCPFAYSPLRDTVDRHLCQMPPRHRRRKRPLRELYAGRLPEYIINRKEKVGWRAPLGQWYTPKAKDLFIDLFSGRNGKWIDWQTIIEHVRSTNEWPGKKIHLYASLAVLSDQYNLSI